MYVYSLQGNVYLVRGSRFNIY